MIYNNWKDTYDEWKLRSPYDDEPEEDCDHEEYNSDWEGRATCNRCRHSWWLTAAQMRANEEASESYDDYVRREMRKERIASWFRPLAFWRRWRKPRDLDDDIPF